jgi:hypothetical protein
MELSQIKLKHTYRCTCILTGNIVDARITKLADSDDNLKVLEVICSLGSNCRKSSEPDDHDDKSCVVYAHEVKSELSSSKENILGNFPKK